MNSQLLPDVNVWVALQHQIHRHHPAALSWFEFLEPHSQLVFCRQTQMGFFRLLTSEAVMGNEARTQRECWTIYRAWIESGRAALRSEPADLERAFQSRTLADSHSPKEWTDAYLAAFAETGGMRLVTFDRALAGKAKGAVLLD